MKNIFKKNSDKKEMNKNYLMLFLKVLLQQMQCQLYVEKDSLKIIELELIYYEQENYPTIDQKMTREKDEGG